MLSVKKRQEYLKYLGFYKGEIDGKVGPLTKKAYKDLQNKYFFNARDKDGYYGPDTEKLLLNVYYVEYYTKNFDILKDKMYCKCKGKYCTGYPVVFDIDLLINLQKVRDKYGSTSTPSCLRCKRYNDTLKNSSKTSLHMDGRAADFKNRKTLTKAGRKEVIEFWFTLNNPRYAYCNEYSKSKGGSTKTRNGSGMGTSVHGDVTK